MISRIWKWLSQPSASIALGVIAAFGIAAGVVGMVAFEETLHATNTDEFCLSCHELAVNIGVDYETRSHAVNATGVRTTCGDCHVSKEFIPKMFRKMRAVGEVYHHFAGTIDTPEKFEAYRMHMARKTWAEMKGNDSRECRSCHDPENWDLAQQNEKAQEFHTTSMTRGKTCIDCHKGIAHVLPAGIEADSEIELGDAGTSPAHAKEAGS